MKEDKSPSKGGEWQMRKPKTLSNTEPSQDSDPKRRECGDSLEYKTGERVALGKPNPWR